MAWGAWSWRRRSWPPLRNPIRDAPFPNPSSQKTNTSVHRVGYNENSVRKALLFMQGNGDFEYRRERRLVHRLR